MKYVHKLIINNSHKLNSSLFSQFYIPRIEIKCSIFVHFFFKILAPSFISGAFATMGLMAGIGAHPISSDKLVGNPTENCEALFERPEYKKADDYISVQVRSSNRRAPP